jgi:DNA-binding NarL/FixJ family response regulator
MRGTILLVDADRTKTEELSSSVGPFAFDVLVTAGMGEARSWLARGRIDIVVADDSAADRTFISDLACVPAIVVVLSVQSTQVAQFFDLCEGSVMLLPKPWLPAILRKVLREAMKRAALQFVTGLCSDCSNDARKRELSARESEVAVLMAGSYPTSQVARKLGISVFTVRNHVRSIYEKLGISSRRELCLRLDSVS